jgi:hypothetical protein
MNLEDISNRMTVMYGGPASLDGETVMLPRGEYVIETVSVEVSITAKDGLGETYVIDADALERAHFV